MSSPLNRHTQAAVREILQSEPTTAQLNNALRYLAKWRAKLIHNTITQKNGTTIAYGPFAGMVYDVSASEGAAVPRLLGAYEASLAPTIDAIVKSAPKLIIDVGCAEGYYAVGMALRLPDAHIWARDADASARTKCAHLAEINGVSQRVKIGGIMTHQDFDICNQQRTVVICDIEGGEKDLLDPTFASGLQAADVLVECHPYADANMAGIIKNRFTPTHTIRQIDRAVDTDALPDWMDETNDLDRLLALWEWRSTPTPWLWMTAKSDKP